MKILEFVPSRYDKGIRLLTFSQLDQTYGRLTSPIKEGQRVLDIGCGTGLLTLRAAQRGAKVKGIDVNPQMLDIAQKRVKKAGLDKQIKLCEMGVAELGFEESASYDVVMSGLCFSELTTEEILFALKQAKRLLKPNGLLLIADEVVSKNALKKIIHRIIKIPLVIVTYLLTRTTTSALKHFPEKIAEAGFQIKSIRFNKLENFIELVAINIHDKD